MSRPHRRHARKASATTAEEIMLPAELMIGLTSTLTPSSPPLATSFTEPAAKDASMQSTQTHQQQLQMPTDTKLMPLIPEMAGLDLAPLFPTAESAPGSSPPATPPAEGAADAQNTDQSASQAPPLAPLLIPATPAHLPDKGILKAPKEEDSGASSKWSLWPGAKKWLSETILPNSRYDSVPEYPTFAQGAGIPALQPTSSDGGDEAVVLSRTAPSLDFERSTSFVPPLSQERIKSTEFWTNFALELDPSKLKRIRFSMPIIVTEFDSDSSSVYAASDDDDGNTNDEGEQGHEGSAKKGLCAAAGSNSDSDTDADTDTHTHAVSSDKPKLAAAHARPPPSQWDVDGLVHRQYRAQEVWELYERTCHSLDIKPMASVEKTLLSHVRKDQLLATLDLTGSQLSGLHMKCFADMLDLNFGLAKLELSHCDIDDDAMRLLAYSLLCNDSVRYLSLANNSRLRSDGMRYISILVRHSKQLQLLDISGIAVRKKSAGYLAAALAGLGANWSMGRGSMHKKDTACEQISLKALRMNSCGIKPAALAILASGIRLSPLQHLSLRLNSLNGAAGPILREMLYGDPPQLPLHRPQSLASAAAAAASRQRPISLSLHGLSDAQHYQGDLALSASPMVGGYPNEAPRVSRLRSLDLSQNDLGRAVMDLAEGLLWNTNLRSLVLRQNKLQAATLAPFIECLGINRGLTYLDISRNPVCGPTPMLLEVLAKVVTQNRTLRGLFMSGTGMTSEGAIILAECLPELQSLERLDVSENPAIDMAGLMALSASIKLNKSLICVEITINTGDDVCAALEQGIAQTCIANMQRIDPPSSSSQSGGSDLFGFELVSASLLQGQQKQRSWLSLESSSGAQDSDIPGVLETKVSGENERYECTSLVTDIAVVRRFRSDSQSEDQSPIDHDGESKKEQEEEGKGNDAQKDSVASINGRPDTEDHESNETAEGSENKKKAQSDEHERATVSLNGLYDDDDENDN
ncbi:hypothetical protein GGI07_000812 [Coemansia sp. Benny D115]|nr:hypothetical protein GGI07_000812 [Coemansia sp. Benny D115]